MKNLIKENDQTPLAAGIAWSPTKLDEKQKQLTLIQNFCVSNPAEWFLGNDSQIKGIQNPKNEPVLYQSKQGETKIFRTDGKVYLYKQNKPDGPFVLQAGYPKTGQCKGTAAFGPSDLIITQEQSNALNNYIKSQGGEFTLTPPFGDTNYEPIELKSIVGFQDWNFPDIKLYKKVGIKGGIKGITKDLETILNNAGYTTEMPSRESNSFRMRKLITQILDKTQLVGLKDSETTYVYPTEQFLETLKTSKQDRSGCKQIIKHLSDSITNQALARDYFENDAARISGLTLAYECIYGTKRNYLSGIFGIKDEINKIVNDRGPYGLRNFKQQNESSKNLKNIIRENLIKFSDLKKKVFTNEETNIVKSRIQIITENKNFELSKDKNKLFSEIISESLTLQKQGFEIEVISEGIFDVFSGLFGKTGGEAVLQTFKEYIYGWLIETLTPLDSKGWAGQIISKTLANVDMVDIPKLTNCSFLTQKLSVGIGEGVIAKLLSDKNMENPLSSILRNAMVEGFNSTEFGKSITTGLSSLICPGLDKISSKLEEKQKTMTDKALS